MLLCPPRIPCLRWAACRGLLGLGLGLVLIVGGLAALRPATFAQAPGWLPLPGQHQSAGVVLLSPAQADAMGKPAPPGVVAVQASPPKVITPDLTIEEAQQQVSFHLRVPMWLPPGVAFRGALVFPDLQGVALSYKAGAPMTGMGIQIRQGASEGGPAFPASAAEAIEVDGQPGVYVHGSWHPDRTWDGSADAGTLSWQSDGFTYILTYSGLNLSRGDLVRVAESMR